MEWIKLVGLVLFLMALLFGYLAWTAKNVWQDKRATRVFVGIAITCTLSVMVLALIL